MKSRRAARWLALAVVLAAAPSVAGTTRPDAGAAARSAGVSVEGAWTGALQLGPVRLRLVLNLRRAPAGWSATLDSIDQNARDIPASAVTLQGQELNVEVAAIGGHYAAHLDGDTLNGNWTQGGRTLPLVLHKTDKPPVANRPQEPKPPLPYAQIELSVENPAAKVRLACSLTEPRGAGPFPAAVLLTGSGPQDRDETIMSHRPFLVLSDALTRGGVAVLRCDDRGFGHSTGVFATATTLDFADDALAAVRALRARPEIAARHIGLVGHSEGAEIAAIAATKSRDVAFVVLLAGPGLPGDQTLDLQRAWLEKADGLSDQAIAASKANWDRAFAILKSDRDEATARKDLRALYDGLPAADRAGIDRQGGFDALVQPLLSPWMRGFLRLDPRAFLSRLRVPVLALTGERDVQVLPAPNLAAMKKALRQNRDATVREMPGLNHLFQHARTGAVSEYGEIEETMSPEVLELVTGWIRRHAQ